MVNVVGRREGVGVLLLGVLMWDSGGNVIGGSNVREWGIIIGGSNAREWGYCYWGF